MTTPLDRYADDFERLRARPADERTAALAALPIGPDERALLQKLLDADADAADPLARALGPAARELAPPSQQRLGPYRLIRELGAGGMGTVFLAERVDGGFVQRVAIKLLRGFPTTEGLRRLRQERQILAGLEHPHIARLLDGGESADGQPWLALEYVDGLPLLEHTAAHAPRLHQRLALFEAMLDAVAHAHQRLVIHRDVKPANVLVTRAGEVKLLDFGIARLVDVDAQTPRATSTRVFSVGYASPEQRDGRAVTTASDIYSLGVLLGELIGGRADRNGSSVPAPLPMDAELSGIVAKATDENPAGRYASAGEFRDDLARYAQGRPVRAARMSRRYRLRKLIGRHRLAAALAALAAFALGTFVWRLDHERSRALQAEATTQRALAASERDAQSARAALGFVTDAFKAAAPENALSREVSVRDLLDAARHTLDARPADRVVTGTMQRLLGSLYASLGQATIAAELLRAGLAGIEADDRGSALRLAADYDLLSGLQDSANDGAAALAAADRADSLRRRYAPDDAVERMRSLLSLGMARHRGGDTVQAVAQVREAITLSQRQPPPLDLDIQLATSLAALLAADSDCGEAQDVAVRSLHRLDAERPGAAPERRELLRAQASALKTCGRWAEAEPVLRQAIAIQEQVVGPGGVDMMKLTTDLSQVLAQLGRHREAAETLQRADAALESAGLGDVDAATLLGNHADLLDAAGDYAASLDAARRASLLLDRAGIGADHALRRQLRRNQARTLSLAGQTGRAWSELEDLRARAERIDGVASVEYASVTWQLSAVARRMQRVESGLGLLDEAERRWTALAPPEHPIFAYVHRCRAVFAMIRGDYPEADREFTTALNGLAASGVPASDIAIARSELAELRRRQGRPDQARELLTQTLPTLRDALLPTEVNRAAAERLATQLNIPQ